MSAPTPTPPATTDNPLLNFPGVQEMLPQLTLGFVVGMASGYMLKILGRFALIIIGVVFIGVQVLAAQHVVTVDWTKLQHLTDPWLSEHGKPFLNWLWATLSHDLPFGASFTAGLLLGLRL